MKETQTETHPEMIFSYTRKQAIEDGVLVDFNQDAFAGLLKDAGIKFPVAMTAEAFHRYVEVGPKAERAGQDIIGRAWDVLWMMRSAIKRANGSVGNAVVFEFYCTVEKPEYARHAMKRVTVRPVACELKAVCGPGDDAEPVITIMLPNED